jgi:hypothetical protein
MAANPSFTSVPRLNVVSVSAANTARDGTGTIVELIAGVAAGTKVNEIVAQAAVTGVVAAGLITVFWSVDGGTTWVLFDEILIPTTTSSVTAKATRNTATYSNLILASPQHKVGVATTVALVVKVTAMAGDLT